MKLNRRRLLVYPILFCLAWGTHANAYAEGLGDLKASGVVGERADGYVGFVRDEVTVSAKALVDSVNAKRRARYQEIAQANGLALADVEALAGQKAIEKTAPGDWIYVTSWRQK